MAASSSAWALAALNKQIATGEWRKWEERWDWLIEAITVIRQLWTGQDVSFKGKYHTTPSTPSCTTPRAPDPTADHRER
jgi:alkanesulfonate monooxygenase SsuD/methylene tetrahydromethanopterin reductase-like flavin-dependent oxidoreductase (luciferase family)